MKKGLIYGLFLALLFISCSKDDEEFYRSAYIVSSDLVDVSNHAVGKVEINAQIPLFLEEEGKEGLLDVYGTSGADQFEFVYGLQKLIDGVWQYIDAREYLHTSEGASLTTYPITASIHKNSYGYYYSAILSGMPVGSYRIVFYGGYQQGKFDLISKNNNDKIYLTIATTASNVNSNIYTFEIQ